MWLLIGWENFGVFKNTKVALKLNHLMDELMRSRVEFTEEDVVLIAKIKRNKLVWLQKRNLTKRLEHILLIH